MIVFSRAWDEEEIWIPSKNRTPDLRIPRSDALPLTRHRDYTVSEIYYEVYMTHLSTNMLLSTLLILAVCKTRVIWNS